MGHHGLLLAVSLIKDHFGQLVAKVCECLLRKGSLSLQEIRQDTGFSLNLVKNCLLVLVKHNCVQAFSVEKQGPREALKMVTLYIAIFENIIHRMRLNKFQLVVAEDLGNDCELVIEDLLKHGRLTFKQLFDNDVADRCVIARRDVLVNRLVSARYVERCLKPNPLVVSTSEDGQPKRGAHKSLFELLTLEKQVLAAATLSDAERFCGLSSTSDDLKKTEAGKSSSKGGAKRKLGALCVDEETQASIAENEVVWRPNFEKFLQCLKGKLCADKKSETLGANAGFVLQALIDSSGGQIHGYTVASTLDCIFERLAGVSQGHTTPSSCQLTREDGTRYYSIDLKAIIKECRNDEVEDLILKRYGRDACRIFRLLSDTNKLLETGKISTNKTFVGMQDTLKILHKLWKDGYLDMEKVDTVLGSRHMSFFLWKVKMQLLWEHHLDDMYHAAFNLNQRIADINNEASEVAGTVVEDQLKNIRNRLESSLFKLDDKIMLFHDVNSHNGW